MISKHLSGFIVCLTLLSACGGKKNTSQVFYGKCQLDIEEKNSNSEIRVDGITVGYGNVLVHAPCGEKRITIVRPGFETYEEYPTAVAGKALKVTAELKVLQHSSESFALSRKLVAQARSGQKIDEHAEVVAFKDPFPGSAVKEGAVGGTAGAVAGAAAGGAKNLNPDGSCAQWCSADDWL